MSTRRSTRIPATPSTSQAGPAAPEESHIRETIELEDEFQEASEIGASEQHPVPPRSSVPASVPTSTSTQVTKDPKRGQIKPFKGQVEDIKRFLANLAMEFNPRPNTYPDDRAKIYRALELCEEDAAD